MRGPTEVSNSACWCRQDHFGDTMLGRSQLLWRELANASDAGGVVCADVGGVESAWANEKTLPGRGGTLLVSPHFAHSEAPEEGEIHGDYSPGD
jgi:hypothetical protein